MPAPAFCLGSSASFTGEQLAEFPEVPHLEAERNDDGYIFKVSGDG
jgi:hypothetical protein